MNTKNARFVLSFSIALCVALLSLPAFAQRGDRGHNNRGKSVTKSRTVVVEKNKRRAGKGRKTKTVIVEKDRRRAGKGRATKTVTKTTTRRGGRTTTTVVKTTPAPRNHYRHHRHAGRDFYQRDGRYYRRYNRRGQVYYEPCDAPIGLRVVSLPQGYVRIARRGRTYYRHGSTFYTRVRVGNSRLFEIVLAP